MSSLSFPKLWLRRFLIFLYLAKVPPLLSFFSLSTTPAPGKGINPGLPGHDLHDHQDRVGISDKCDVWVINREAIEDEKAKKGRRSEGLKMSSRKKLARRPKVQNFERVDNIEKVINTISQIFIKLKMFRKMWKWFLPWLLSQHGWQAALCWPADSIWPDIQEMWGETWNLGLLQRFQFLSYVQISTNHFLCGNDPTNVRESRFIFKGRVS